VYIYAAVAGKPSARTLRTLARLPDGGMPRLLPIDANLSAVVADVPSDAYNPEAIEKHLTDLDWVAKCGTAHHAVADALSPVYVVLPFRLFTLFSSEAKALASLRKLRGRIGKAVARVRGRKEWVLRIGRPDPARLAGSSPSSVETPASGTTFLRGKADRRRESIARDTRAKASAAAVVDALEDVADETSARDVAPGMNLLVDAAFLVSTRKAAAFRKTLERAAAGLLDEGCPVTLTGPWPPYSFASAD